MINSFAQFEDYSPIIKKFGPGKLDERVNSLKKMYNEFIKAQKLDGCVIIDYTMLQYAVLDYFSDIGRLKDYHKIERTNYTKVKAYTAYWLLRRRPLQIIRNNDSTENIAFCNELFVYTYISSFLFSDINDEKIKILENSDENSYIHSFLSTLYYYLKYRQYNAQVIELMMLSALATKQLYQMDYDSSN